MVLLRLERMRVAREWVVMVVFLKRWGGGGGEAVFLEGMREREKCEM